MQYFFYIIEQDTAGDPPLAWTYLLTQGEQAERIKQRLKSMTGDARIKHKVEIGSLFDVHELIVIDTGGYEYMVRADEGHAVRVTGNN